MPNSVHIIDNHSELSHLVDDTHPQYVSISGVRSIVARHDFNTGSSPFTVGNTSSGVLVIGFNAELWGGHTFAEASGSFGGGGGSSYNQAPLSGYLLQQISSLSGYNNIQYDTILNSSNISGYLQKRDTDISGYFINKFTGYYTIPQIDGLSGYINTVSGWTISNFDTITNSSNISGYLVGRINTVSGYSENTYSKRSYLDSVSGYLLARDASISGYNITQYDTISNSINISGFLYGRIDTVSGYLQSQLVGGAVTLTQLNNVSGYLYGRIDSVSGYSNNQYDTITNSSNISGYLAARIISISGYATIYSNNSFDTISNASNVSGYLANRIISVSGYGTAQYDTISNMTAVSGYLANRIISVSGYSKQETIGVAVSDETTDLTTGTAKVTFRMPFAMTLSEARINVNTAPSGSTIIVDVKESATTIFSTKPSIDISEKTSTTAATPAVISDSSLADDAEITVNIDQVGATVAGKGLKLYLIGTR